MLILYHRAGGAKVGAVDDISGEPARFLRLLHVTIDAP